MLRSVAVALAGAVLGWCLSGCSTQHDNGGPGTQSPDAKADALLGKPAPALKLELLQGGELNLAAHKGKQVVVLDFWATWCGPCVKALPIVNAVTGELRDKGVVFYAVDQQEEPNTVDRFLRTKHLAVMVALDRDGKAGDAYQVDGIPHMVIIGKDGTVQWVHEGYDPDLQRELKKALEALLAGRNLAVGTR